MSYECEFLSGVKRLGLDQMIELITRMKSYAADGFDRPRFEAYCKQNGYDWAVQDLAKPLNEANPKNHIGPVEAFFVFKGTEKAGKEFPLPAEDDPRNNDMLVVIAPVKERTMEEEKGIHRFREDDDFERD